MRQGCISLGEVQCAMCHGVIADAERYLVVDEENGVEAEKGKAVRYCVQCALKKGYAHYKDEGKDEKILTFFPE